MANYKQSLKDVKTLTNNMDLYQADEMCDNGRKIMKVFLQHVIVEISIKKIS